MIRIIRTILIAYGIALIWQWLEQMVYGDAAWNKAWEKHARNQHYDAGYNGFSNEYV